MEAETLTKFQEFLSSYLPSKNILFLIDSNHNIWELVKRIDLQSNSLINNYDKYPSVRSIIKQNYEFSNTNKLNRKSSNFSKSKFILIDDEDTPRSKLLNIEIKEDEMSFNRESELDISKVTDMNLSHLIRDIND